MVAHGPSGVRSRTGGRDDAERLKELQLAVQNANAYKRRWLRTGQLEARSLRRVYSHVKSSKKRAPKGGPGDP